MLAPSSELPGPIAVSERTQAVKAYLLDLQDCICAALEAEVRKTVGPVVHDEDINAA